MSLRVKTRKGSLGLTLRVRERVALGGQEAVLADLPVYPFLHLRLLTPGQAGSRARTWMQAASATGLL